MNNLEYYKNRFKFDRPQKAMQENYIELAENDVYYQHFVEIAINKICITARMVLECTDENIKVLSKMIKNNHSLLYDTIIKYEKNNSYCLKSIGGCFECNHYRFINPKNSNSLMYSLNVFNEGNGEYFHFIERYKDFIVITATEHIIKTPQAENYIYGKIKDNHSPLLDMIEHTEHLAKIQGLDPFQNNLNKIYMLNSFGNGFEEYSDGVNISDLKTFLKNFE